MAYTILDNRDIDLIYNPESENAQSGKAVAEAMLLQENRSNNSFANTIKNTVSGTGMVTINDISPIEHSVKIKVLENKNLFCYSSFFCRFR